MIPANVYLEIDPTLVPPGPAGKSAYQCWSENGHTGTESQFLDWLRDGTPAAGATVCKQATIAPGATTGSLTYVTTGLACNIDVPAGKKVRVEVTGAVNHSGQNFVHFTVKRGTTELHSSPLTGLACSRIDIADGVRALHIDHLDAPSPGTVTYELFWRCHNAATAYLGRRPADTAFMIPTTLTLTLVDA